MGFYRAFYWRLGVCVVGAAFCVLRVGRCVLGPGGVRPLLGLDGRGDWWAVLSGHGDGPVLVFVEVPVGCLGHLPGPAREFR